MQLTEKEVKTLLTIKQLLNCLRYVINKEDLKFIDDFHKLCRKYCFMGER